MDYKNIDQFSLFGLDKVNIILGKNGCGKSYCLKRIEEALKKESSVGKVRYITPERAGFLTYEPGIDQAISNDPTWMPNNRRHNQSGNFK